jgi:hypothetical protein
MHRAAETLMTRFTLKNNLRAEMGSKFKALISLRRQNSFCIVTRFEYRYFAVAIIIVATVLLLPALANFS